MFQLLFLVHLESGGHRGQEVLLQFIQYCQAHSISYQVRISEYKGHTLSLIQELAEEIMKQSTTTYMIIIGGDGTLNEAVNGLQTGNIKLPIAYFPAGTGNDFARELQLQTAVEPFIQQLMTLKEPIKLEILQLQDNTSQKVTYAINSVGFGFDALIAHLSETSSGKGLLNKLRLGKLSYISQILAAAMKKNNHFTATITNHNQEQFHVEELFLLDFMNHSYFGGGIQFDPESHSNNHEIGLVIAHHIGLWDILRIAPKVLSKDDHFTITPKFSRIASTSYRVQIPQSVHMQKDGEWQIVQHTDMTIRLTNQPFWNTSNQLKELE